MLPISQRELDPELEESVLQWFEASQRLYEVSLEELAAGRALPPSEPSPSAISFEVAMNAIKYGLPCPRWAAEAVSSDWNRFRGYEVASIGDAFGIPDHKHRAAKHDALLCAAVYSEVRKLQATGVPLKPNARGDQGALSQVGERFHMSGKKVEALMKQWKDLCKLTGSNPDARPAYADPLPVMARALAAALRGLNMKIDGE